MRRINLRVEVEHLLVAGTNLDDLTSSQRDRATHSFRQSRMPAGCAGRAVQRRSAQFRRVPDGRFLPRWSDMLPEPLRVRSPRVVKSAGDLDLLTPRRAHSAQWRQVLICVVPKRPISQSLVGTMRHLQTSASSATTSSAPLNSPPSQAQFGRATLAEVLEGGRAGQSPDPSCFGYSEDTFFYWTLTFGPDGSSVRHARLTATCPFSWRRCGQRPGPDPDVSCLSSAPRSRAPLLPSRTGHGRANHGLFGQWSTWKTASPTVFLPNRSSMSAVQ